MYKDWWKIICIILLVYTCIAGLHFDVPRLQILNETIRALHFHVPMWFGMIILLLISFFYSIKFLNKKNIYDDIIAVEFANVGIFFGVLGVLTGMIWANFTWGDWWSGDPKQNSSAIGILIYLSYLVLRGSIENNEKRAMISGVYNIFAFMALLPLLFILPRLTDSLHPGNGGNPGFNSYDLDSRLRLVFYPAVLGWTLLGVWVSTIRVRLKKMILR